MTNEKTTDVENLENPETSDSEAGSFPDEGENADAGQSRKAILHMLGEVESQLQQAAASRRQIGEAAYGMRRGVHQDIEQLEQAGIGTPEAEERYRQLLLDRRHCDVVGALNQQEGP